LDGDKTSSICIDLKIKRVLKGVAKGFKTVLKPIHFQQSVSPLNISAVNIANRNQRKQPTKEDTGVIFRVEKEFSKT
jgi:hypothetical protein